MLRGRRIRSRHFSATSFQRYRCGCGGQRYCHGRGVGPSVGQGRACVCLQELRYGPVEVPRYGSGVCRCPQGVLHARLPQACCGRRYAGRRPEPSRLHHQRSGCLPERSSLRRTGRPLWWHGRYERTYHPHAARPGRDVQRRPLAHDALHPLCYPAELLHRR